MRFKSNVAVVTGGSSGIGLATVKLLCEEGAKVYNLDICESNHKGSHFIRCDVSQYLEVKNAIKDVMTIDNNIHILFANAGIHKFANIEETSVEDYHRIISINCGGIFYLLKTVLPIMKSQQGGRILLMGSDQSIIGKESSAVYGMSKGAIAQLTKSTAIDYAAYHIKVNCICPGTCNTPLLDKAVSELKSKTTLSDKDILTMLEQAQPVKRLSEPAEVARLACFLMSSENSYMTGSLISVDGGYTCQ